MWILSLLFKVLLCNVTLVIDVIVGWISGVRLVTDVGD